MGRWLPRLLLAILSFFVLARAASAAQTGGGYYAPPPQLAGGPPPGCGAPMPCGYVDGGVVPGPAYVDPNPPRYDPPPQAYVDPDPPYGQGPPPAYVDPNPPSYATGGGQYSGGSSYTYSQSSGGGRYGPGPGPGCDPCQQQGGGYAQGYVTGYREGYRDGYGDALYGGGYSQQSYDRRWNSGCGCYPPPAPCQPSPRYDCRTGEVSLNNSFFYDGGGVGPAGLGFGGGGGGGGGYAGGGAYASAGAYASSSVSIRVGGRGGGRPPRRGGCGCK